MFIYFTIANFYFTFLNLRLFAINRQKEGKCSFSLLLQIFAFTFRDGIISRIIYTAVIRILIKTEPFSTKSVFQKK